MRFYFDQALLRTGVVIEPSGIVERARRIRAFAWIEQRLFEVVGGWVSSEADAMLRVLFDTESRVHGRNSLLWRDEMPPEGSLRALADREPGSGGRSSQSVSSEDQNALVAPGFVAVMNRMEADAQDAGVVSYGHLGILCEVILPRLLLTYRVHMAGLSPVADGSFARSASIAYDDIIDVWHAANLTLEVGWRHGISAAAAGMQFDEYIRWAEVEISGKGQAGHSEYVIGLLRCQVGDTPSPTQH